MNLTQLIALWVGILAVMGGGFWRVMALLVKIASAVEAVPGLTKQTSDHETRLLVVEGKVL